MGEVSEDIINGLYCQLCGCFIDGEEPGYPRYCEDCEVESKPPKRKKRGINEKK